ncbi:MAG TPA: hypothetical protein VK899_06520 [Gemmatimonadales bacterium]|nr:hypothetical protein [Gemmatimonadales bacterium]
MRVARSRLGWLLVAIYLVVFVVAYFNAAAKRGTFLYDIWLDILSLPYIAIVGRLLLQSPTFAVHAHEPWGLVPAVVFCSAMVLLLGAIIEHWVRSILSKRKERSAVRSPEG